DRSPDLRGPPVREGDAVDGVRGRDVVDNRGLCPGLGHRAGDRDPGADLTGAAAHVLAVEAVERGRRRAIAGGELVEDPAVHLLVDPAGGGPEGVAEAAGAVDRDAARVILEETGECLAELVAAVGADR